MYLILTKKCYKIKVFKAKIVSDNCQFYLQIKPNPSMHTVLGKSATKPINIYIYKKEARLTEGGMQVLKAIKVKVQVIYKDVVFILYSSLFLFFHSFWLR